MLFDIPKNNTNDDTAGKGISKQLEHRIAGKIKIEGVLDLVDENSCVHWVTEGDWSMHDLLAGLLLKTGPADVYISSYAFSEYPARIIADFKSQKIIENLFCLIDSRIDTRSASALMIITNCATKLKLVHTHAKITVIENKTFRAVVVGSANYTTNKRYEAGLIICNNEVVDFHKNWIKNELDKA